MDFTELGFSPWVPWSGKAANQAPRQPGVYIFRMADGRALQRLKGQSDLVYVGSTKKGKHTVQDRLRDHLRARSDGRDVGCRIHRVLQEVGPLEVAWKVHQNQDEAQLSEWELLSKYEQEHIEFPPLNRQETGKAVLHGLNLLGCNSPERRQEFVRKVQGLKRKQTC